MIGQKWIVNGPLVAISHSYVLCTILWSFDIEFFIFLNIYNKFAGRGL